MSISEKQRQQQAELHAKLWTIANDLRGNMDASEFKNYILGLIFYRYLSEKVEKRVAELLKDDPDMTFLLAWKNEEYRDVLKDTLQKQIGYFIEPQYLFNNLLASIETNDFEIELLQKAINQITNSTMGTASQDDFENLFDDMDLSSTKLGKDYKSRGKLIAKVMSTIANIQFSHEDTEIDVLGDAYEYLIGQFAANAGKKAGEYYTPQQVSKILAKIVANGKRCISDFRK